MPKVGQMKNSKFLKKEDVGEDGTLVTIVDVREVDVAMENDPPEMKWCLFVEEFPKPMVLNSTNAQLCEKFLGSDDTDDWAGKQVILYDEPNVSFGGKLVGGIRVKRAKAGAKALTRPTPPENEEVPFPSGDD